MDTKVRSFDMDEFDDQRGPRVVDDSGADALGRGWGGDAIPPAGNGFAGKDQWLSHDTRDLKNAPTKFLANQDGAYIGGAEVGHTEGIGAGVRKPYEFTEIGTPGAVAVRLGDGWALNAVDPGIAPAASANFPDSRATELKRKIAKGLGHGLFRSVLDGDNLSGPAVGGAVVEEIVKSAMDRRAAERADAMKRALASLGKRKPSDDDDPDGYDESKAASDEETSSATVGVTTGGKPTVTPQNIGNTPAGTPHSSRGGHGISGFSSGGDTDEDEEKSADARSAANMRRIHQQNKARRVDALTTPTSKRGGRLDGNRI